MDRRDYVMRMIEQMGAMLARVRRMLLGGEPVDSELMTAASRAGVDLEMARLLDARSLLDAVAPEGQAEPGRCWVMAELLALDGERLDLLGRRDEALDRYGKALLLFGALHPSVIGGLPEAADRIAAIERRLEDPGGGDDDGNGHPVHGRDAA